MASSSKCCEGVLACCREYGLVGLAGKPEKNYKNLGRNRRQFYRKSKRVHLGREVWEFVTEECVGVCVTCGVREYIERLNWSCPS
jgi:hypothetical protein